jgi:hypothetical protein
MPKDWYPVIELPISWDQFWQLPRNPAYKYEYFDGKAWLSPRPKAQHVLLKLRSVRRSIAAVKTHEKVAIRRLADKDWRLLPRLFAAAFQLVQPYSSLNEVLACELRATASGGPRQATGARSLRNPAWLPFASPIGRSWERRLSRSCPAAIRPSGILGGGTSVPPPMPLLAGLGGRT